jgi:hypothetical protein
MHSDYDIHRPRQRLTGVVCTIALHLVVLAFWLQRQKVAEENDGPPAETIEWIDIKPEQPKVVQVAKPAPTQLTSARPVQAPMKSAAARPPPPLLTALPATETAPDAPAPKSAYEMLQQARRDVGKIDRDLKREYPDRLIRAPIDTPQKRLVSGIELAHELAPPKWYQPSKITELTDPGGYGRKRYRIVTAHGTYCMTYESHHSPDGRDAATRTSAPKMTNCDPDEAPVKPQQW